MRVPIPGGQCAVILVLSFLGIGLSVLRLRQFAPVHMGNFRFNATRRKSR